MSKYYLETISEDGNPSIIIALDAVLTLSETFGGKVTRQPMADRNTVSDSFINDTPEFNLNGIISGVVQPSQMVGKDISEFTSNLIDTVSKGTIVNFISSDRIYDYCIIEKSRLTKTSREGIKGWSVDLDIVQLNLVDALKISIDESPLDEIKDDSKTKTSINSNTTSEILDVNEFSAVTESIQGILQSLTSSFTGDDTGG